jgi:hypothetical protein
MMKDFRAISVFFDIDAGAIVAVITHSIPPRTRSYLMSQESHRRLVSVVNDLQHLHIGEIIASKYQGWMYCGFKEVRHD